MVGSPISLAKVVFSSYFAGIGRTKLVMICDLCGLVLNIPLCYAMVFGVAGFPEMGIAGAALSTILSTLFALLLFVGCFFAREHRQTFRVMESFVFDLGIMRRFIRLGLPAGTELFLNVAAFNLFLLMFQGYGITEAASAAIVFNWDILCFVPMIGLNIGVVSLIGRFVGARDMNRTNEVIFAAFVMGLGYSGLIAIIYSVFRFQLVGFFEPPQGEFEDILALAGYMMIGLSSYVMADATIQVAGGVLRGAGDTKWLMYASTTTHWVALAVQYYVIKVAEWGPRASWVAFVALLFAIALLFSWRLWGGRWREEERLLAVMAE
jgi:MATE family multidrug resistance protein